MKIIVYREKETSNFGDALNEQLWPKILPADFLKNIKGTLSGIGSVLTSSIFPRNHSYEKPIYVIGSGAGYGPLPTDLIDFRFLALRGPLTERALQLKNRAITDAAILLAGLPRSAATPVSPKDILFMPHLWTMRSGRWSDVAERVGMKLVDPRWPVDRILTAFSNARLVIAEALHGAIVADAYRIPWIPIRISPDFNFFKWRDWAASMDMTLELARLPQSSLLEKMRFERINQHWHAAGHANFEAGTCDEALIASVSQPRHKPPYLGRVAVPNFLKEQVRWASRVFDEKYIDHAATWLNTISQRASFLSDDNVFQARLSQMQHCVNKFVDMAYISNNNAFSAALARDRP